jgi:ribonuclease HI
VELEVQVQNRRPGDVMFHELFDRPTAVDFTIVSPFVLSAANPIPPRWLAKRQVQDAEKHKVNESAELCASRGFGFIAAGFDVAGGRGEGATKMLEELESKLKSKTPAGSRGGASIFARAHTCIARSIGSHLDEYFTEVVKYGHHLTPPPTRASGPTPPPSQPQSQPTHPNHTPTNPLPATPTPTRDHPSSNQAVSNSGPSPPAAQGESIWVNSEPHPNLRPDGKLEQRGRPTKAEEEVIAGHTPPSHFGSAPVSTPKSKAKAKPKARKWLVVYASSYSQRDHTHSGFAMFINHGHPGNCTAVSPTPNENRASIVALLLALEWVPGNVEVEIRSHSDTVRTGMQSLERWVKRGWEDAPHSDLWRTFHEVRQRRSATTRVSYVSGSSGDEGDRAAWQLAKDALRNHNFDVPASSSSSSSSTPTLTPNTPSHPTRLSHTQPTPDGALPGVEGNVVEGGGSHLAGGGFVPSQQANRSQEASTNETTTYNEFPPGSGDRTKRPSDRESPEHRKRSKSAPPSPGRFEQGLGLYDSDGLPISLSLHSEGSP